MMPFLPKKTIYAAAREAGFDTCGIAKAELLEADAIRLEKWLHQGMHGTMQYMENFFDLRIDPRKLVPGAKSVITLLKNYFPPVHQEADQPSVATYAYGRDYHQIIRNMLKQLLQRIKDQAGPVEGRGFVDSAPVLERAWAVQSGLGWVGKNGNLITKQAGSFFFIATLITDLETEYDDPFAPDYCGTCTRCIDACPTGAILPGKVVNGSSCISYFTIEWKEMLIPEDMKNRFENWIFGCDTCQDVCPWNRFSRPHHEPAFTALPAILNFTSNEWQEMTEAQFREFFKGSPLQRAKFSGIQRNLKFIYGS